MKMITLYCGLIAIVSCQGLGENQQKDITSPKGYKMESPERFKVRESLQEISGIVFYKDEEHIMSINDEQGKVFQVGLRTKQPYPFWKFGKSGDYEEIVFTGKDWIVLKSNGTLYVLNGLFTDTTSSTTYHFPKNGSGAKEFEAAYFDSTRNSTIVICKNCEDDKGTKATSAYAFSMDSLNYSPEPVFSYKYDDIPMLKKSPSKHFRPSAAALHPIENKVYIVASINRLLVITDLSGKVLEAHRISTKNFNQPEGITFAPNGDMYISNEGDEEHTADILKFKYHPQP